MLRLPASQRETCFLGCLTKQGSCDVATGVPVEIQDRSHLYGGFQRGQAPFASSRMRGSRGRNPIERVSPSVRFFGYFLSVQKVTRGSGPEVPVVSKRKWNIRGVQRIKISYFVAAGAVEEKFVDKEKNRWEIKKNLSTGVCGKSGGSSTAFHRTECDRNFPQAGCKTFWGNGGKLRG